MNKIFEAALSINEHWHIRDIEFDPDKKQLALYVDFKGAHSGLMKPVMMARIKFTTRCIKVSAI